MEGVGPLGEESTLHMPVVTPDEAESLSESLDADWTRASRDPLTFSSDDDDAPNLSASFFLPDVTDVEVHAGVKVTARTFDWFKCQTIIISGRAGVWREQQREQTHARVSICTNLV